MLTEGPPTQPREPQWDKPAVSGRAILGCFLLVAVAAASGLGLWAVRSGQLRLDMFDRLSSATPTPTPTVEISTNAEATTTIEVPTPESSPLTAEQLQNDIEAQYQQKVREMEARLKKARQPDHEVFRTGGEVTAPVVVSRVEPKYTETARRARIQGVVIVEATVDWEGYVREVRVLKGLPMGLDQAAKDAVKQWKFRPATRRGEPVDAYLTMTVQFRLQ